MNQTENLPSPPPPPAPEAKGSGVLHWVKWWLIGLTVLTAGLWAVYGTQYFASDDTAQSAGEPAEAPPGEPRTLGPNEVVEGPWGRLEIVPITISPPVEFVAKGLPGQAEEVAWHFPSVSRFQLASLLHDAGLPEAIQSQLMALARPDGRKVNGYVIRPGRDLILGLSPETRAKLYAVLHEYRENLFQRNAFRFCGTSTEQWFHDSAMSPETARLIAPLIYRHGSFMLFADAATVGPMLPSARERNALVKTLAREATLLVRLKLSHDSDIESLANYWGRGGRVKDVRPILESFSRFDGQQGLDITHLLPPFARQRIYTYPTLSATPSSVHRDCYWTAMNFFSERPDDGFGEIKRVRDGLGGDYYRIYANPQFGDLVFFVDHADKPVHAAVYIAADILFTKNGPDVTPWMFLKLENMKDYYPRSKGLRIAYFRRKGV